MWHAAQSSSRPTHEEIDGVMETEWKVLIPTLRSMQAGLRGERRPYRYRGVRIELALVRTLRENASEEAFHGRRARPIQRQSLVFARRDEHRDLHVHAVVSVPAVQERRDQHLAVSNHVDRDGCGDILIRVRVPLLLRLLAREPDRRGRAGSVLPARR